MPDLGKRGWTAFFVIIIVVGCCISVRVIGKLTRIATEQDSSAVSVGATLPPIAPTSAPPTTTNTPIPPTATPIPPTNTPAPSTPTQTPVPTNTPTPAPTYASENGDGYLSGGLGLSRSDWEKNHTVTNLDFEPMGTGYDQQYDVMFQVGNVWQIERQWSTRNATTVDVIDSETQKLTPADRQFIKSYSPEGRPETIVNLYHSDSLKARFNPTDSMFGSWWGDDEPGNFIVMYNQYDGGITRMIIATGNNP